MTSSSCRGGDVVCGNDDRGGIDSRTAISPLSTSTTASESTSTVPKSMFRRKLPPPSVELSSEEGTKIFAEAMADGTAQGFFPLIEMLHTQQEPAYCGLATLVTVLNACSVDPRRAWRGPWRFYSEELLDCCVPLDEVREKGIGLNAFACLARCNGLEAIVRREVSLDEFREAIERASRSSANEHVALSYSRATLGQTGDGHFSPVGAYHRGRDLVLILDVARFKYRPHWAPLALIWAATNTVDSATGLHRGFAELRPRRGVADNEGIPPSARLLSVVVVARSFAETEAALSLGVTAIVVDASLNLRSTLEALAKKLESVVAVRFCCSSAPVGKSVCTSGTSACEGGASDGDWWIDDDALVASLMKTRLAKELLGETVSIATASRAQIARVGLLLAFDETFWRSVEDARRLGHGSITDKVFVPLEELAPAPRAEVALAREQLRELRRGFNSRSIAG